MKAGKENCALKFHVSANNIYYEIVSVINKLYWDWALKKLRDKGIGECNFKQRTDILGQA